eukprot:1303350-Pyramimonas_sp.AAC.1
MVSFSPSPSTRTSALGLGVKALVPERLADAVIGTRVGSSANDRASQSGSETPLNGLPHELAG